MTDRRDTQPDLRAERRHRERVGAGHAIQLTAEMNAGPGKSFVASVLDTSASGARLVFDEKDFPRFQIGAPVELRFYQLGVGRPISALGQICNQARLDGRPTVGVRFSRTESFHEQLTPELWTRFNCRWRPRVALETTAKLQSGGRQWSAPVHDICAGGVSLNLEPLVADELAGYELVRLYVELPLEGGMLFPTCLLVHQTPFGRTVRHGLRFDEALTANLEGQQERIDAFARSLGV